MSTLSKVFHTSHKLPVTNYVVVDIECHGLAARVDPSVDVYFACTRYVGSAGKMNQVWWCIDDLISYLHLLVAEGAYLVYHNAKFDHAVLQLRGLKVDISRVLCTQVLGYLDDNDRGDYSLASYSTGKEDLIQALVDEGFLAAPVDKQVFWNTNHSDDQPLLERLVVYCQADVGATSKLYYHLRLSLENKPQVVENYFCIDQPMLAALINLEQHGALIDKSLLQELLLTTFGSIAELEQLIKTTVGGCPQLQFNGTTFVPVEKTYKSGLFKNSLHVPPFYTDNNGVFVRQWGDNKGNSHIDNGQPLVVGNHCPLLPFNANAATGHVWWVINRVCPDALDGIKETKTGKPKLNKDFISDISELLPESFPIGKLAKAIKRMQMATSIANAIQDDGRIRCEFAHTRTLTGRLATSNPNLQNLPRAGDSEESQMFRKLFVPSPGNVLLCADLN
jgi:DNA polymerase I-like protein with 3'-5' exonuclease and polymerase domains